MSTARSRGLRARFLNRSYRNLVLVRTGLSLLLVLGGAWLFASAEMALLGLVLSMAGAAAALLWPFDRNRSARATATMYGGLGKVLWTSKFRPTLYGSGLVS